MGLIETFWFQPCNTSYPTSFVDRDMWTWWKTLAFLLALLLPCGSNPTALPSADVECGVPSSELAVDDLVEQAKTQLEDPLILPEKNGLINLVGGVMRGLSSLNRSGPVIVSCNSSTVTLRFLVSARNPIRAQYEWDKKVPTRTLKGSAYARTTSLEAKVTLVVPRLVSDTEFPQVTKLEILRMNDVEVNISGLAHVTWLWSRAIAFMTSVFENAVTRSLQERLKASMNDVLRRTNSAEMQLL